MEEETFFCIRPHPFSSLLPSTTSLKEDEINICADKRKNFSPRVSLSGWEELVKFCSALGGESRARRCFSCYPYPLASDCLITNESKENLARIGPSWGCEVGTTYFLIHRELLFFLHFFSLPGNREALSMFRSQTRPMKGDAHDVRITPGREFDASFITLMSTEEEEKRRRKEIHEKHELRSNI